jgi:regulator of sigma E protease
MLTTVLSILAVAVGLGLVIFVHELGHFMVAKWVGVLVERFSIGFGPILWSLRRGETEYAISAIPFGGYVKMLGQDDANPGEMVREEMKLDPRSYPAQSVPKRMAIISAGVVMNVIFGFLFFLLVFNLGVSYTPAVVGYVEPGGPAWVAGLERGDRILKVNGREVLEFETFQQAVMLSAKGAELSLEVDRDGSRLQFQVTPKLETFAPQIGVGDPRDLVVNKKRPVIPGTAAAQASGGGFRGGDRITHCNDIPIKSYARFSEFLARHADEEVIVRVQRASSNTDAPPATADLTVLPQYLRNLAIPFEMGKITAIRVGSPGDRAGLKVGDVVQSIDGKPFDPLRLPSEMDKMAGQGVEIEVKRQSQAEQTVKVVVVPEDRPSWLTPPIDKGHPLSIASIGIAYQLRPKLIEEPPAKSPAARAGLQKDDRIVGATLIAPAQNGSKMQEEEPIEFTIDDHNQSLPCLFWLLQEPGVKIKLVVKRGDSLIETPAFQPEEDPTWAAPFRGITLDPLSEELPPQGFTRAIVLGYETTRSTLTTIYLSLRRLIISRTLSVRTLSGPVSIAVYGYHGASTSLTRLIKFLAILSINLAVINFLPIPVLDGGHMVFLTWEWIRGKPASERVVIAANYCGLLLIITLALLVTGNDIWQLVQWSRG